MKEVFIKNQRKKGDISISHVINNINIRMRVRTIRSRFRGFWLRAPSTLAPGTDGSARNHLRTLPSAPCTAHSTQQSQAGYILYTVYTRNSMAQCTVHSSHRQATVVYKEQCGAVYSDSTQCVSSVQCRMTMVQCVR